MRIKDGDSVATLTDEQARAWVHVAAGAYERQVREGRVVNLAREDAFTEADAFVLRMRKRHP